MRKEKKGLWIKSMPTYMASYVKTTKTQPRDSLPFVFRGCSHQRWRWPRQYPASTVIEVAENSMPKNLDKWVGSATVNLKIPRACCYDNLEGANTDVCQANSLLPLSSAIKTCLAILEGLFLSFFKKLFIASWRYCILQPNFLFCWPVAVSQWPPIASWKMVYIWTLVSF